VTEVLKQRWFYIICIAFALINLVAITFDFLWIGLLPLALIFTFLVVFKLDKLLILLAFLVPLSISLDDVGFGFGISLPDEPLIIGIMVLAVFKFVIDSEYDFIVLKHPITIAILINLFWLFITACTSQYPFVSFKFLISRFWYIVVFYFLGVMLFRHFKNIVNFFWLYMIPLLGVVIYTLYKHSLFKFSLSESYNIMRPFFIAHGIYAATLCMFIPLLVFYVLFYRRMGLSILGMLLALTLLIVFLFGIYFSYTRAAWIGVAVAVCFIVPVFLRIKFNTLLIIAITTIAFGYTFQNQILYVLSKNQQKSADGFSNHLQSISNIKTDPSNTERINRWMSAISMFEAKPVLGFGPGTYSFCYAPFQQSKYLTVISTNFGDGGNSHSEYLNPLAESGLFGLLTLLLILYFVLSTGFRLYYTAKKFKVRMFSLAIVLGLITYLVHGFLNNYTETDKIAALFWGGFGMLTALDLYHNKQKTEA
jgi:putative inorganic carbon (HCO3(-)) transporter